MYGMSKTRPAGKSISQSIQNKAASSMKISQIVSVTLI